MLLSFLFAFAFVQSYQDSFPRTSEDMFSGVPPPFANQPLLDSEPDGGQSVHTCVIPLGSERELRVRIG